MHSWRQLTRGMRALLRRRIEDRELADEVEHFFAQSVEAHRQRGLSPAEAARAARLECGDPDAIREQVRAYGWENTVEALAADLRQAGRQLRRRPGFVLAVALVLALGIGVGTAMFSVLDAALLQPLPYLHPDRLVEIREMVAGRPVYADASGPDARDWQQRTHTLAQLAYCLDGRVQGLELAHETDIISEHECSANLFATLGVAPALGRGFVPGDQAQRAHVVVLSDLLWRSELHADPHAVGQTIRLGGDEYTVIGVMPPEFSFPFGEFTLWTPYAPAPEDDARDSDVVHVIARLRPGIGLEAAQAEIGGIQAGIARQYGNLHLPRQVQVRRYRDALVMRATGLRPALLALSGAVALVWLIACAAAAGLLLTRWAARRQELAVRVALGGSRTRIIRQLLAESGLLGVLAAFLGLALAEAATSSLAAYLDAHLPMSMGHSIHLDARVLLALLGLTLLSVVLVGLVPAWLAARTPARDGLRVGAVAVGGCAQSRLRDALVVAEIALTLTLLAGAGVLLRTLYALRSVPLGFTTENVMTAAIQIPPGRFAKQSMRQYLDVPLLARLQSLPGVRAAAITSVVPLNRMATIHMSFDGTAGHAPPPDGRTPKADVRWVSPGYLAVFGIPLERGRFFDAGRDTPTSAPVVVVNHSFATQFLAGEDPVGQRFLGAKGPTIIGVLANVHDDAVAQPPGPVIYFSTTQLDPGAHLYRIGSMFAQVAVRTRIPPGPLAPAIRTALHGIAPDLALGEFTTMRQLVAQSIGDQTFAAELLAGFGLTALVLALAGLYGLLACAVAQRTREIGVRMALGADRRRILALVLGRAGWLLAFGIALGWALALAASQMLAAYVYHVAPRDPLTLAGAALLLAAAGFAAAYLPARRATHISPLEALRAE